MNPIGSIRPCVLGLGQQVRALRVWTGDLSSQTPDLQQAGQGWVWGVSPTPELLPSEACGLTPASVCGGSRTRD